MKKADDKLGNKKNDEWKKKKEEKKEWRKENCLKKMPTILIVRMWAKNWYPRKMSGDIDVKRKSVKRREKIKNKERWKIEENGALVRRMGEQRRRRRKQRKKMIRMRWEVKNKEQLKKFSKMNEKFIEWI